MSCRNVPSQSFRSKGRRAILLCPLEAFAEAVHQRTVGRRKILKEAVDGFDYHPPLRQARDGAERVQPYLELDWHTDAQLRVVLDSLSLFGSRRRSAGTTTWYVGVGHGQVRWRGTAEIRALRRVSDRCRHSSGIDASENIMFSVNARIDPIPESSRRIQSHVNGVQGSGEAVPLPNRMDGHPSHTA